MRMRRKKHLNERISAVSPVLLTMQCRAEQSLDTLDENLFFNKTRDFGNENPTHIEIGCGKGGFALKAAKAFPNVNFIAIEKNPNVLISGAEFLMQNSLPNLKFVVGEAENLLHMFKKGSADRIYLNFSCPYFKKTYFRNRLTHTRFLRIYHEILTSSGDIHMKTDNQNLFEFSLEHFSKNGYCLNNVSLNLHKSEFSENIMTEYEEKFVAQGMPIYRVEAVKIE